MDGCNLPDKNVCFDTTVDNKHFNDFCGCYKGDVKLEDFTKIKDDTISWTPKTKASVPILMFISIQGDGTMVNNYYFILNVRYRYENLCNCHFSSVMDAIEYINANIRICRARKDRYNEIWAAQGIDA